jgi:uncharacterized membrane protein YccF (DUF307 family)
MLLDPGVIVTHAGIVFTLVAVILVVVRPTFFSCCSFASYTSYS